MVEFKIYTKGVSMKNKKMFLLIALIVTTVLLLGCSKKADAQESKGSTATGSAEKIERKADGQYLIGSKIKIYDGDLKPTDAYFTYLPSSYQWEYKQDYHKAVLLNQSLGFGVSEAFLFGINEANKNEAIGFFRNSIDKSIEWAATAKQNNVHSLKKQIPTSDGDKNKTYVLIGQIAGNPPPSSITLFEPVGLFFIFYIGDYLENGKEETLLIMAIYDSYGTRVKRIFCFRENDFALLKEIFSESYLAEIDKKEETLQKSQAEQGTLFK
jgi:hypothetical protein